MIRTRGWTVASLYIMTADSSISRRYVSAFFFRGVEGIFRGRSGMGTACEHPIGYKVSQNADLAVFLPFRASCRRSCQTLPNNLPLWLSESVYPMSDRNLIKDGRVWAVLANGNSWCVTERLCDPKLTWRRQLSLHN